MVLVTVDAAVLLSVRRSWAVGAAAALIYGALAFGTFVPRDRLRAWTARHPAVDSAMFGPLLFGLLASATRLSTGMCVVVGAVGGVAFVGITRAVRMRRTGGGRGGALDIG